MAIEDAVINAGLVFFGFLMAVGWDRIQKTRADKEGRDRVFSLIKMENTNNALTCQAIISSNLQGITTIPRLNDIGWNTALSNWPLLKLSPTETIALTNTYRSISAVSEALRARDTYAVTMIPMSNYAQTLTALNDMLRKTVEVFVSSYGDLLPLLDARLKKAGRLEKLRVRLRRR